MPRHLLSLLLPTLLLAACGQLPSTVPGAVAPETTPSGKPAQQALPGVFQIDFNGISTHTPTSRVQSLQPGGLRAQGLVSAPDQFSFSRVTVQTFTTSAPDIRHVRVTYKVTNTSSQALRNPKFVAVVPQGSTTDSVFTNVQYFDGSDASAAASKLTLVQGQTFNPSTNGAVADPLATPVLTGLDISTVDTTDKGIKTLTRVGWSLTTPATSGRDTLMAPGDTALITFGVNVPMTPAADGGATKDPFNFSLNVTAVQDAAPVVALSSAVKQWDAASRTFWNYVKFPTRTYMQDGVTITRSLPAYYDISTLDGSATAKVLCAGDANMSVTNISTAGFPNRWRVQLWSLGAHTLNVFGGMKCPGSGTPLLSQTVTGVGTSESSLAGGNSHSLALRADGTVQGWGYNNVGQLGDGTTTNRSTPVTVSGLSGVTSLSAGYQYSLALKADGTVWSWGLNDSRQLGDDTRTNRNTPVTVLDLSDMVSISAGEVHNLALRADGTVWSWGENLNGQLGDGTRSSVSLNRTMVSGLSGVASVSAGNRHSLALKADGTVWSWGYNAFGQLGDGTNTERTMPVAVSGLREIRGIATGGYHSLALKADGTVQSWGNNSFAELGDGTSTGRNTPGPVSLLSGITSIGTIYHHNMALKADGTVQSWGDSYGGQLGDGTTTQRPIPLTVSGLSGITRISPGYGHSMALKSDGTIWVWGSNSTGQLGDGTTTDRLTPGPVGGLSGVPQPTP